MDPVSLDGANTPDNLLALCPNCHTMHHAGIIPIESLRAWKHILLSLNSAFDRDSVDLLLTIKHLGATTVSADGVLRCAALIASGLVHVGARAAPSITGLGVEAMRISLSEKGKAFVGAWLDGKEKDAYRSAA